MAPNRSSSRQQQVDHKRRTLPSPSLQWRCAGLSWESEPEWLAFPASRRPQAFKRCTSTPPPGTRSLIPRTSSSLSTCIPLPYAVPCTILLLLQCHTPCIYPTYYRLPTHQQTTPQALNPLPHSDVHPQQRAARHASLSPARYFRELAGLSVPPRTRRDIPPWE